MSYFLQPGSRKIFARFSPRDPLGKTSRRAPLRHDGLARKKTRSSPGGRFRPFDAVGFEMLFRGALGGGATRTCASRRTARQSPRARPRVPHLRVSPPHRARPKRNPPRAHPRRRQILGWTLIALRWFIRHERHQRHAGSSPGASPARVTGIPSARRRHPSSVAVVRAPHASTGHPDRSAPRERTRNQHRVGTPRRPVADPRARPPSAPRGTQDNPQFFVNPLQFEIQYECLQNLANGACPPASRRAAGPTNHRRCRFSVVFEITRVSSNRRLGEISVSRFARKRARRRDDARRRLTPMTSSHAFRLSVRLESKTWSGS